uniref:hypothetical protein n=1 Tax=Flavobacterium sp. TaxID=239 RepID=UPI00404B225D
MKSISNKRHNLIFIDKIKRFLKIEFYIFFPVFLQCKNQVDFGYANKKYSLS